MIDGIIPNATGALFGWDFQINTAIMLFLRDPQKITKLRVEGKSDDIEIQKGNTLSLAQCKSISKQGVYTNVSRNYTESLISLNRDIKNHPDCESLIFATNTDKPLGTDKNTFSGYSWFRYNELPPSSAKKIDEVIKKKNLSDIDTEKLIICVIPFMSEDFRTRYRRILDAVNKFLSEIDIDIPCDEELTMVWQQMLLRNASTYPEDEDITLTKEQLIWPLIVILMAKQSGCEWLNDEMDDALREATARKYKNLISVCENRLQFCFKVLHDYNEYKFVGIPKDKMKDFVIKRWHDYVNEVAQNVKNQEEQEMVTKIIVYRILLRRIEVENIKNAVNMR